MNLDSKAIRVSRLTASAQARAEAAKAAAHRAITALESRGMQVTFASVAESAGVSVSYLYKEAEIADRIKALRGSRPSHVRRRDADRSPSERSMATKLTMALERVGDLEREIDQLRRENRNLLSRLMDAP